MESGASLEQVKTAARDEGLGQALTEVVRHVRSRDGGGLRRGDRRADALSQASSRGSVRRSTHFRRPRRPVRDFGSAPARPHLIRTRSTDWAHQARAERPPGGARITVMSRAG